jgi:hypothetical protein
METTKKYLIDAVRELIEHDSTSEQVILGWIDDLIDATFQEGYEEGIKACQENHI